MSKGIKIVINPTHSLKDRFAQILAVGILDYLKNRGILRMGGKGRRWTDERAPVPVNRPEPPIRRPSRPLFDLTSDPGRALLMRRRNAS